MCYGFELVTAGVTAQSQCVIDDLATRRTFLPECAQDGLGLSVGQLLESDALSASPMRELTPAAQSCVSGPVRAGPCDQVGTPVELQKRSSDLEQATASPTGNVEAVHVASE